MNMKTYKELKKLWNEDKIEASHNMILCFLIDDLIKTLKHAKIEVVK